MTKYLFFFVLCFSVLSCRHLEEFISVETPSVPMDTSLFHTQTAFPVLNDDDIDEASGIAASQYHQDAFWVHNDSGDKPRLFLVNTSGETLAIATLKGLKARDWEDIAINLEDGVPYIYVAEIGDNKAQYNDKFIYRFPEPMYIDSETNIAITDFETIEFAYPVATRDAESLLVDPLTKDIVVVSKRETHSKIFELAYPYSKDDVNVLIEKGELPFRNAVAGDVSRDGSEILLKTYDEIFLWRRTGNESIADVLLRDSVRIPYQREPQGEAIAWSKDGHAFYTLSEERKNIPTRFYEFRKIKSP